ncbi:hypothetical protein [Micromonospora sp. NPDC004551]|uniref:hypothetical protein n=1 Tax=Micromonospora sp. NPDC004551 TaxID=3154284 RepID=UPI0033AA0BFD
MAKLRRDAPRVAKIADPDNRKAKAEELAKYLYELRRQVIRERTEAAGILHVHEGRPLAQLVDVITPRSRNQGQLRTQITRLGAVPPKVVDAEEVLEERSATARGLTELMNEVRALRG